MPRPCLICSSNAKLARAAELIAAGTSDQATADALNDMTPTGKPMSLMAVSRHRRLHVLEPARAVVEMAGKDQAARELRQEQQAAIERGDPLAIFKLDAIANDISRIAQRLDSSADEAAEAGQHGGHAALAGQLLRQAELRMHVGGYDEHDPVPRWPG